MRFNPEFGLIIVIDYMWSNSTNNLIGNRVDFPNVCPPQSFDTNKDPGIRCFDIAVLCVNVFRIKQYDL